MMRAFWTARRSAAATTLLFLSVTALTGCSTTAAGPPSKDSGIEGVPVPLSADEMEREREPGLRVYALPTMSFAEALDWYDKAMPARRDYRDWKWCAVDEEYSWQTVRVFQRGDVGVLLVGIRDSDPTVVYVSTAARRSWREDFC